MVRKLTPLLVCIAVLVCLGIPAGPVEAAMREVSIEEMAVNADAIVVGTVVDLTSQWNSQHTRITTLVTLSVEDTIKGVPGQNSLVVSVPGGKVDGITEWVEDAPIFILSECSVVFLKMLPQNRYEVYGQVQGKYSIEDGMVGGMSLFEFKQQIQRAVQRLSIAPADEMWRPCGPISTTFSLDQQASQEQSSASRVGWGYIMFDDFEDPWAKFNWSAYGNPTWGRTVYRAYQSTWSLWCAGSSGVDPGTGYPNNMNAWMIIERSLPLVGAGRLNFWSYVKTGTGDFFRILASTDGNMFYGYTYGGAQGVWLQSKLDLRDWPVLGNLCSKERFWLAIVFQGDGSGTNEGVYIDNVGVESYGFPPVITAITPPQASAGTNTPVTITGSNFGTIPGTVVFFTGTVSPT